MAQKRAKVEDRPGVTRGNQWFSTNENFLLLDTPGVLWPKFEDTAVAERLAITGAIKDTVLDIEELAVKLLDFLIYSYQDNLINRYKIKSINEDSYELLCDIAASRGMLARGGSADTERAAIMLVDEFRGGKIGQISLEKPNF